MRVFRRNPRKLQFEADGTLRFVHFCGRQPICLIGLPGSPGARLLLAARQVFPQFFGGPIAAQFRLLLDRGFAALLRCFQCLRSCFMAYPNSRQTKSANVNLKRRWKLRLALAPKLWQ
jgi:hypothetical protein